MASAMCNKISMRSSKPTLARKPARLSVVKPVAALDPATVIGGTTVAFLSLGRFVFLPYQRREADYKLAPKTSGTTYFDDLQMPASFITKSNDPAGFNLIDVMGWGALGHAAAFCILAINSAHDAGINPFPTSQL